MDTLDRYLISGVCKIYSIWTFHWRKIAYLMHNSPWLLHRCSFNLDLTS